LLITTPRDVELYRDLFDDGSRLGMRFDYAVQDEPDGLARAFILGRSFVGGDSVTLVLGDNIFFGHTLPELLLGAMARQRPQSSPLSAAENGCDHRLHRRPPPRTTLSSRAATGRFRWSRLRPGERPRPGGRRRRGRSGWSRGGGRCPRPSGASSPAPAWNPG
ncbi:hypothetical protein EHM82_06320, partial [bacterium]